MVIFTVTTSGGWFTYYLAILEHLYKKEGKMKDIVMKVFYAVRALPGVLWTIYLLKDYKARNFGQGTVDKNACLFYEEKTK